MDTEELQFEAWLMLIAEFGKTMTREEYLPLVGHPAKENMDAICKMKGIEGGIFEELNAKRRGHYKTIRGKGIPPIAENVALAKQFMEQFPALRKIAVSSNVRSDIKGNLRAAGLLDDFEFFISFEDRPGLKHKPAPDLYLYALEQLGSSATGCLSFEDSESGVNSSVAAQITCVALPNALTLSLDLSKAALIIRPGERKDAAEILEKVLALHK